MLKWLDSFPWSVVIIGGVALALAPFSPEPHLWEKLKMWQAGTLNRPIDIFDLALHAAGLVLIVLKGMRMFVHASRDASDE
jgi:hypothetical protein